MRSVPPRGAPPPSPVSRFCDTACRQPPHPTDGTMYRSIQATRARKQGQCPRSSGRRWRHSANAGGEACRRERQGTHPSWRLHAFGRSHPNPTLTTACLLHNAVRAGPIFAGISTLVVFAGITAKVRARSEHVRMPSACACLLPCIPSSGGELAQQEAAMASRCSSSTTRLLTDPCSLACLLARLLACSARSDQTASLASAAGMSDDPPLALPGSRPAVKLLRITDTVTPLELTLGRQHAASLCR